eukprot:jgi/Bigna1/142791/aug1.73_g17499
MLCALNACPVSLAPNTLIPTYHRMPNRSPLKIQAVIFDLDGTLIDSEMASHVILGMSPREGIDAILQENQITEAMMTREEYIREFHTALEEGYDEIDRMPGSLELVKELKAKGCKLALCTSTHRKAFDKKMRRHKELVGLFDVVITGEDPEIRCLVFDDSAVGVRAAKAGQPA